MDEVHIRHEAPGDIPSIRKVNELAFDRPGEAALVGALRKHGGVTLALVAEVDDAIVGHILFSPAMVVGETGETDAVALAPIAVLPGHQRQGIGTSLIEHGLALLREAGHGLVIVLGHADYYPRFGFVPASQYDIRCPFQVPDEAFMALELRQGAAPAGGGVVRYREEFASL